jgi:phosphomannomutase
VEPTATVPPIRFGTSGWRGILGDEITLRRTAAAAAAIAEELRAEGARGAVLVAHDRRFGGARLAECAARVLAQGGVAVVRVLGAVPTPAVARAILRERAAGAVLFTASHNAPHDQGMKLLDARGGSAVEDLTRRIERRAAAALAAGVQTGPAPRARPRDVVAPYLADLGACLDRERLRRAQLHVAYDAMHGAGAGVLDTALERAGVGVERLRAEPDLRFGGGPPDPLPERLSELRRLVSRRGDLALGLATDGDADRFAAVDGDGRALSATEAVALLVDHLAGDGRLRRGVAISTATGSLVERVARAHGLEVERHPIGFKHLTEALAAGRADVAGEESGGFAWSALGHDKDGILAACLVVEAVAAARAPLAAVIEALRRRHGASACGRAAVPATARTRETLARLREAPPERVAGAPVRALDAREGLRLELDDGFLMLRASGTEGVVRVYAEAGSAHALAGRLALGCSWLGARGPARARGRAAGRRVR